MSHDKNKEIINSYYKYIADSHVENVADESNLKEVEFPNSLDEWFDKYHKELEQKRKQKERKLKFGKYAKRFVAIACAMVITFSIVTVSIEAVRVKVLNYFSGLNNSYLDIGVDNNNNNYIKEKIPSDVYYPEYLTKGYKFKSFDKFGEEKILIFENDDGNTITFMQSLNGTRYHINADEDKVYETEIASSKAVYILDKNKNKLIWNNATNSFCLLGLEEIEELIKIAKSIKK